MSYASTVLADSPYLFYEFAEASGTTVTDSSGNGHNGAYVNTPTLGVASIMPGVTSTCVSMLNSSSQGTNTTIGSQIAAPFSIETWFKLGATPPAGAFCLATGRDGAEYTTDIQLTTSGIHCDIGNASGWLNTSVDGTVTWSTSTLYHHVLVVTSSAWTHYLNGSQLATGSIGSGAVLAQPGVGFEWSGNNRSSNQYINAKLQMAAIYTTALSATRVSAHYNAGTGTTPAYLPVPTRSFVPVSRAACW